MIRYLQESRLDFRTSTYILVPIYSSKGDFYYQSLLLISYIDDIAIYYDSVLSTNRKYIARLYDHFSIIRGIPLKLIYIEDYLQLKNNYDYRIYVYLLIRYLIISKLLSTKINQKVGIGVLEEEANTVVGREEIKSIVVGYKYT